MKSSLKIAIVLAILMALLITLSSAQTKKENKKNDKKGKELETFDSYKGSSKFLNSKKKHPINPYKVIGGTGARVRLTCDKFPRVCHTKGSPGGDCCGKRCVNVKTDNLNCGMCGRKCRFPEVCCNGRCINLWYDRKNCGACHNKCKKGSFCYYGMCSYA
ncbi:stigma-specific STIG1-like protein 1 [Chenopodium quinoa]|uniref:stigma-specific STIG1-like protein 1 n=1 Tax=Chenopodium quinoa TaxID=63459 RepID=UPI000B77CF26|nr:stigma-specific STIG1-like protein 1 [Chenopodium quinoa]